MKTNSLFICEGLKQAGLILASLLLLGGIGWLDAVGYSTTGVLKTLGVVDGFSASPLKNICGLIVKFAISVITGPVPTLLTLFDNTNKQLFVLSCVLIIPYWACLGAIAGFLRSEIEIQDAERVQIISSRRNKKYTRWMIVFMALVIAAIFYPNGPFVGLSGFINNGTAWSEILGNVHEIDLAKKRLASDKKLSPDYLPTETELASYVGGTNFFNRPAGAVHYVINPINKPPYAVVDADWRIPRHGWRGGYTITNGTVFRLQ